MTFLDIDARAGRILLGGRWEPGTGTRDVVVPADGSTAGTVGVAGPDEVGRATEEAVRAQRSWAALPFDDRARVLRAAAALLEAHAEEYAGWLVAEAGSARGKAAFEVGLVIGELHFAAALALAPTGQVLRTAKPRLSLAQRAPVGVVGVISPFNFPGVLSMRSVAPALALGNAVVLKPDPRTAVTGGLFLGALLVEAGLPEGLLSVLPGGADVGEALVDDPAVRVISFTGSTAAGRAIGERAGRLLKRAHLELGGNNALVVLDDVDVDAAVSAGAWGSFLHQGQICMTTGRHVVHASVYDRYVEGLAAAADRLPVGDPRSSDVPLGPIIDARQRDHVHELVTASVDAGARLAAGGTYEGLYYRPTVLADVRPDHRAFAEEVFGPVAPVLRFDDVEELVGIVNRSEYGLSLGVLTRDVMRGLALAERLPSGIVHINDQTVDDETVAPFGGVAASGTGVRFGGFEANAEAFTETRWITAQGAIERYPVLMPAARPRGLLRESPHTLLGRALGIIGTFADAPDAGLTLTGIAQRSGLPMTTVHRLAGRLEDERLLERDGEGRYRVGLRLWELGLLAPRPQSLRRAALPILEDLYAVARQNVQLMVLDGTDAVVVERLSARDAIRLEGRTGGRLPVHATSGGIVLLAHADEASVVRVLREPLQRFTPSTITVEAQLRAALALARRQGWIALRDHLTPGSVSVAAPVRDARQQVVAAVSVVSDAVDGDHLVPAVRTAALAIGRTLR